MIADAPRNMTELELAALRSNGLNLADAHARQRLSEGVPEVLAAAVGEMLSEPNGRQFEEEEFFRSSMSAWTSQPYDEASSFIVYSASVALDLVAKQLQPQRRPVGIVTPCFDNIPDLFRRNGLILTPVSERLIMPDCDVDFLDSLDLMALIVAMPNNPTALVPTTEGLQRLIEWAATRHVQLVLDMSFRLFAPALCTDPHDVARACDADLITIDDTGKILPLRNGKVGLLSVSRRLVADVSHLCSDLILGVSELDLRMLGLLLSHDQGSEVVRARRLVQANQSVLDRVLGLTTAGQHKLGFQPSISWINIGPRRDQVLATAKQQGLEILPGDRFVWNERSVGGAGKEWVRVAMMRDTAYFTRGMTVLAAAIHADGDGSLPYAGR